MEVLQQVEAVMGPAGLDNPDGAAPSDLLTAAVQHLRTSTPTALVRACVWWCSALLPALCCISVAACICRAPNASPGWEGLYGPAKSRGCLLKC